METSVINLTHDWILSEAELNEITVQNKLFKLRVQQINIIEIDWNNVLTNQKEN